MLFGIVVPKFDVVETWLNTVGYSHSGSKLTVLRYRDSLRKFSEYVGKAPQQIYEEYLSPNTDDKKFKMRYAQYLKGLIGDLQQKGYAPASISTTVNVVKSFFKYSDLPLGFVPSGSDLIEFHNRDMERTEILEIMKIASPRERAFFCLTAQSGLRPSTIVALKIKDVEGILDENTPIPCLIKVKKENTKGKFAEYFTFIGEDSVRNIKDYFKTRTQLTPEDYLFTMMGKEDKPLKAGVESHLFERLAKKLRKNGILDFKTSKKDLPQNIATKKRKYKRKFLTRSEFRLYNLRKFFRKYAGQAGMDFVNFWMGHLNACGVDLHYFSKDVEHHRQVYKEKAMSFLRLQSQTPSETERTIAFQQKAIEKLKAENAELKLQVEKLSELPKRMETLEREMIRNGFQNSFKELVNSSLQAIEIEELKAILKAIIEKKEAEGINQNSTA